VNLNNVSLLQSEKLRRKTTKAKKEKLMEEKKAYYNIYKHNWRLHRNRGRIWAQLVSRKG